MTLLALALTCILLGVTHAAGDWKYDGPNGVDSWDKIQKNCAGRAQSPVNIDTSDLIFNQPLAEDPFNFHLYKSEENQKINMSNSGYSIQLLFHGEQRYLTGAKLPADYNLLQIHFHWGSEDWRGSEHAKDGQYFPLEMHVVHTNEMYNVSQALVSPNGLAVLGFFFEIGDYDNPGMENLIRKFDDVIFKGQYTEVDTFPLYDLFPEDLSHFYRYEGSLTTPGCFETVIWTVFDNPIPISKRQMNQFRRIREDSKEHQHEEPDYMNNNYRPLQELHGRLIYTTARHQDRTISINGGVLVSVSWLCTLLAFGAYHALL